jgi:hypothetical protein
LIHCFNIEKITSLVDFGDLETTGVTTNLSLLANRMEVAESNKQKLIIDGNAANLIKNNLSFH